MLHRIYGKFISLKLIAKIVALIVFWIILGNLIFTSCIISPIVSPFLFRDSNNISLGGMAAPPDKFNVCNATWNIAATTNNRTLQAYFYSKVFVWLPIEPLYFLLPSFKNGILFALLTNNNLDPKISNDIVQRYINEDEHINVEAINMLTSNETATNTYIKLVKLNNPEVNINLSSSYHLDEETINYLSQYIGYNVKEGPDPNVTIHSNLLRNSKIPRDKILILSISITEHSDSPNIINVSSENLLSIQDDLYTQEFRDKIFMSQPKQYTYNGNIEEVSEQHHYLYFVNQLVGLRGISRSSLEKYIELYSDDEIEKILQETPSPVRSKKLDIKLQKKYPNLKSDVYTIRNILFSAQQNLNSKY